MDKLEPFVCRIQNPPVIIYTTNFKQKWGVQEKRHIKVGVPSKHAKNEYEKNLNHNNNTKRNINGQIGAICMQDSEPPGYYIHN